MLRRFRHLVRLHWVLIVLLAASACAPAAAPPAPTAAPAKPAAEPARPAAPAAPAPAASPAAAAPAAPAAAASPAAQPAVPAAPAPKPAARNWPLPSGDVTLNLWDSAEQTKALLYKETLIPEYKKLHPNVTVNYESISTADMLQKLLVALSTGTGPELFVLTDWFMPTYFSKNLLEPAPPEAFGYKSVDEMVNAYIPGRLEPFMKDGKLYAIPYQMNSYSIFINNRLFKEAGLDPARDAPKSWEDIARLNQQLTKREGDRVVKKGYEMRYSGDHWMAQMFHFLIYQAGGDVLDKDGKPIFNQEPGVKALNLWKSVSVAPQVTKNTSASPYQDFADEQDIITYAPPNAGAVIELLNPNLKGGYTVVPFPQMNPDKPITMMYSFNLVVNARASDDKKKVAWDFIHNVTSKPQLWMEKTRMINPVKGWYDAPEARQVPYLDIFVKDLSYGKVLARTEHYNELQSALARAIERVILQNADPKQSLDQAAQEYSRAAGQ